MAAPKCTDQELIEAFKKLQSGVLVARHFDMSREVVRRRKLRVEAKYGIILPVFDLREGYGSASVDQRAISTINLDSGTILVGSDGHIWGRPWTTAQRAFLKFVKELKPAILAANGDMFDGARISRFPSIGWETTPEVKEELEAVQEYMDLLLQASPNSKRFWPAGNHDLRFESRLSQVAQEYRGIRGLHLKDHVQGWVPCWRVDVNDNLVIKHRWHAGVHATYNNTLKSGKSIVTGHLHSLQVRPWSDYLGTRYGVDSGCLAEPYAEQFIHYSEASPVNWRSGFVVLTIHKGRLLMPELVQKYDDTHVEFRGQLIEV